MRRAILLILLFFCLVYASEKWSFLAEDAFATKPIVEGTSVYAGSYDGNFYAFQISDGSLLWYANFTGPIETDPVLASQYIIAADSNGKVSALDKSRGKVVWSYNNGSRIYGLLGTNTMVYVTMLGRMVALDSATGRIVWEQKTAADADVPQSASPAATSTTSVFAVFDDTLYSFDALNGNVLWKTRIGRTWKTRPVFYNDAVFVGCTDNTLYAVDARNGVVKWTFTTNAWIASTPLVYNNDIFFGSNDNYLYALNAINSKQLWKFKAKEAIQSEPAVSGRMVLFGSNDGRLYAVDIKNGTEIWTYNAGNWVHSPAVAYNFAFFGSHDKRLHALGLSTQCSIDRPERNAAIGNVDMTIAGKAYAERGVSKVEMQMNKGGWQTATGTTSWSLMVNPADLPDGEIEIECRLTDTSGNRETAPYYSIGVVKSSSILEEITVDYPAEADVARKFNISVKDKYGFPLSEATATIDGKKHQGNADGVIEIYLESGGQKRVVIERRGYRAAEITISGRESGATTQILLFFLVILLGVGAYLVFMRKGRKEQGPQVDEYGMPLKPGAKPGAAEKKK